jgi:hypothetical protein
MFSQCPPPVFIGPPPQHAPPIAWPASPQYIHTTVIATTSGACCDAEPRRNAIQGTALAAMQGTGVMRVATYNIGTKSFAGTNRHEFRERLVKDFVQLQAVVT